MPSSKLSKQPSSQLFLIVNFFFYFLLPRGEGEVFYVLYSLSLWERVVNFKLNFNL